MKRFVIAIAVVAALGVGGGVLHAATTDSPTPSAITSSAPSPAEQPVIHTEAVPAPVPEAVATAQPAEQAAPVAEAPAEPVAEEPAPAEPTISAQQCLTWLYGAGVVGDINNAWWLARRVGICTTGAVNPASGCSFGDGACEIAWMHSDIMARYGSWNKAVKAYVETGTY